MSAYKRIFFLFLWCCFFSWGNVQAESILTPFVDSPVYSKKFSDLSSREQAKVKLHGIRSTMLHPKFWGTLQREKTYNVRITPMKRYFLRASESPTYRPNRLHCQFRFAPVDRAKILKSPHEFDPLFEIGFGVDPTSGKEKGYGLRVSAYPLLPSALLKIENSRSSVLAAAHPPSLGAYQTYTLDVEFSNSRLLARLNGADFLDVPLEGPKNGMISLISSWHPVYISDLEIHGTVIEGGQEISRVDSGLLFQERGEK